MMDDRPEYASYDSPRKFQAIQGIVGKRLLEHPNAILSYSGGSDSDTMLDIVERARKLFNIPLIKYAFFNTGLEMKATKDHVREQADKYGITIDEYRPKLNIVLAVRKYGIPFMSKMFSERLYECQNHNIPIGINKEFQGLSEEEACERMAYYSKKYPLSTLRFLVSRDKRGVVQTCNQTVIDKEAYLVDFLMENPPDFKISAKCCQYCKKEPAHKVEKDYEMLITGEREAEGGVRAVGWNKYQEPGCFRETAKGQFRLRPLYYVTDEDKAWYKEYYGLRYSDAYEVYGFKRTGCCGCPISYRATQDLEVLKKYEPQVVKAAYNIFGKSYEYRAKYNEYKKKRRAEKKSLGTISMMEELNETDADCKMKMQ